MKTMTIHFPSFIVAWSMVSLFVEMARRTVGGKRAEKLTCLFPCCHVIEVAKVVCLPECRSNMKYVVQSELLRNK